MSIILKTINKEKVSQVPKTEIDDKRPILGYNLFPEIYANIFLCAKKKSGKTTVIYNIIRKCVNKHTKIIAFVSTLTKDKSWITIRKFCKLNNIEFEGHTSLKSDDGVDLLDELVNHLQLEYPEDAEDEVKPKKNPLIICDGDTDDEDEKPKKSKYQSPEYLIILDDLSNELKSNSLITLLKKNRHFKSKILLSSQYLNDLKPESRKQMDYFLVFRGQPRDKLSTIYKDADVHIDENTFYKLYSHATKDPFNFLYIDCTNSKFRKNFNQEYTT
jgi:hypothetical protein